MIQTERRLRCSSKEEPTGMPALPRVGSSLPRWGAGVLRPYTGVAVKRVPRFPWDDHLREIRGKVRVEGRLETE